MSNQESIRHLDPPEGGRVETGIAQFGDDWPGIFIRGDNAFGFAMALRMLEQNPNDYLHKTLVFKSLKELLESCDVRNCGPMVERQTPTP